MNRCCKDDFPHPVGPVIDTILPLETIKVISCKVSVFISDLDSNNTKCPQLRNQSGYEPLNLKNGLSVNSDSFDATDLRFQSVG